jgi:hypothetical protein
MTENTNASNTLKQVDLFKRKREFAIFDEHYLKVSVKDRHTDKNFVVDLRAINPQSQSINLIFWHWLGAMVVTLLASALLAYGAQLAHSIEYAAAAGVALIPACVFGITFLYTMEKKKVFVTRFGKVPIIELMAGKPNHQAVDEYLKEIEYSANQAVTKSNLDKDQLRAGEVRMLRRLSNGGVLNKEEYARAKDTAFGSKATVGAQ